MGARTIHIEYTKGSILGNVRMVHYGWSSSAEILAMSQPGIRRLTLGAGLGTGFVAGLGGGGDSGISLCPS